MAMGHRATARLALPLLFGGVLCGALVYGQGFGQQPAKLNVVKLKEDLFVIHNDVVPGNSTALLTNEGVVLVDDKFEIDHANILSALKTITTQPIKYVVNTHHHADHSGSNAKMQRMNVQVVATEEARENMVEGKQTGLPNIVFDRHAHIYLGGKTVELYHFGRSHTNGDLVAYFPAQRTLAAGDMFTFGDATPELIDYSGGGSAKEWSKTLDSVLQLDFDAVVPGHGVVTTKQEMRRFRDSTISLWTKVHDLIGQKKTRSDIEKVLRADFHWADLHVSRSLDGLLAEAQ